MKNYKNICSKEELEKYYIEEKMPVSKIAMRLDVSYRTMRKIMFFHGVDIKGRISSNKYLRDKKWLEREYLLNKKSVRTISIECGSTRGNVYSALKYAKIPIRTVKEGVALLSRIGENTGNWRGGKRLAGAHGRYIQILSHGHPHSNADNYVMEHILVMEEKIGRYLTKDEIVHHIDGDGHNNDISNLQLTTRKKHFEDHFDGVKKVNNLEIENKYLKQILKDNNISF